MEPQTPSTDGSDWQTQAQEPQWQAARPHLPGQIHTPATHEQMRPPMPPEPRWQPDGPVPPVPTTSSAADPLRPMPVVRVLSPVGIEYVFLTILLFVGAGALVGALLTFVNGALSFGALSFPAATLVVAVPAFAWLFLRLKKMELRLPEFKLDPSKRRSTQFTQIVAFIASLFSVIGTLFAIFTKLGGESGLPIGKVLLNGLCVLVVAGGILAYYWREEHRGR